MTSKSRLLSSVVNKSESLIGASLSNPNEVNLRALETAATQYTDVTTLPASGYIGEQAYVASTNRLYIWTGTGWFNIALVNTDPTISSAGDANYTMSYGTPITVDVNASDPEGLGLSYSYYTSDSIGNIATITNDSSQFTITPSSNYSVEGSFGLVFRASDGPNIASSSTSTFTLTNQSPSLSGNSASYVLATDGSTPTVITLTSVDPEGQPITYTATGDSGFNAIATVSNDSSVFTIIPKSEDSAVSGTGSLTFTASDGVKSTNAASSFTLTFVSIITDSKYTTLLATATGTSDNNNITDASTNSHSITVNGDAHAGTFSPYRSGGYSTKFEPNSYFNILNQPAIGSGDCSIECWVNVSTFSRWHGIIKRGTNNASGNFQFYVRNDTELYLNWSGTQQNTSGANIQTNTWHWLQVIRSSGTVTIYVDGVSRASFSDSSNISSTTYYDIGGWTSYYSDALIRDLRVSTVARSSSTGLAKLEVDSDTTFLTCNSPYVTFSTPSAVNNYVQYISGPVSTKPFSPYDYAEYDAADHGGSVYFDGTGDNLDISASSDFDFGTGDFTFEMSFYAYATSGGGKYLITNRASGWGAGVFQFTVSAAATNVYCTFYGYDLGGYAIVPQTWNHLSAVKSGDTITLYLNGITPPAGGGYSQSHSGVNNVSMGSSSKAVDVGSNGTSDYFKGYIGDLRIVKGTAITPPAGGPTSTLSSTGAALHIKGADASIIDKSQSANLKLIGNTTGSTTQAKFSNTKSMYFDGTGDRATATGVPDLGDDFTIECWVYSTATGNRTIVSSVDNVGGWSSNGYWSFFIGGGNYPQLQIDDSSYTGANTTLPTDQWVHLAVTRTSNTVRYFINGSVNPTTFSNSRTLKNPSGIVIGSGPNNNYIYNYTGYIQDLRISNECKYTANFTPPTAPLEG